MVDSVIGPIILLILIYYIIWFFCQVFNIPLVKYEQMIIQTKFGQQLVEIDYVKYFVYLIIVAVLYDTFTTCSDDPLGINECKHVDPREYDSYRGRR